MDPGSALLATLQARFEANPTRHEGMRWSTVRARLEANPEKLRSLAEMERTGGEPDVVGRDGRAREIIFYDCSKESPKGRRSVCYDGEALEARKKHKPGNSAVQMALDMGAELLTVEEYQRLQGLGEFDTKTSSWLRTPPEIRELGGAIFGDFRYGTVFVYHNGAESYYAARGFRCSLRVKQARNHDREPRRVRQRGSFGLGLPDCSESAREVIGWTTADGTGRLTDIPEETLAAHPSSGAVGGRSVPRSRSAASVRDRSVHRWDLVGGLPDRQRIRGRGA